MQEVNKSDLSGTITGRKDGEGFCFLRLSQKVADQFETSFTILAAYEKADAAIGDKVLILNATAYEKDGSFRFKICSPQQLIILKKNPDLGVLDARDKFF